MKEGQLEQAAFELSQALKIIIGDIKSKPNDTRYLTSLKKGANALLKYDELRSSKEGQTQGPVKIFIADFKNKVVREKSIEVFGRPDYWNTESETEHTMAYEAHLIYQSSLEQYPATWITPEMDGKEFIEGKDFFTNKDDNAILIPTRSTQEPVGGMKWIDVNDRLPIEEKYYHTKGSDMCCYWHSDTKKFDLKGVTHWLDENYTPPPAPIKKEGEGDWKNSDRYIPMTSTEDPEFTWQSLRNMVREANKRIRELESVAPPSPVGIDVEELAKAYATKPLGGNEEKYGTVFHSQDYEAFKSGYSAPPLPQSSTEEEKDLWNDALSFFLYEYTRNPFDTKEEVITKLLSTYKISKR